MKKRKPITRRHIMALNPCYDPSEIGFDAKVEVTPLEFIDQFRDKVKSKEDVLWLLCRKQYMSDRDMRLLAVWCAREALKLVADPDPRSVAVCDVSERFADGEASDSELAAAMAAAMDAAWAARAARAAAWAAWDAAEAAARYAARYAAMDAARAAMDAAEDAARYAAWYAARDVQIDHLRTYFMEEAK